MVNGRFLLIVDLKLNWRFSRTFTFSIKWITLQLRNFRNHNCKTLEPLLNKTYEWPFKCIRKLTDLVLQTIYLNSKQKLHSFPSNESPLKLNTLSHPSLSCNKALLEGFFWDAKNFILMPLLMFSTLSTQVLCGFKRKKRVTRWNIKWRGRLFQICDVRFSLMLSTPSPVKFKTFDLLIEGLSHLESSFITW